jgi:hypothetical protein
MGVARLSCLFCTIVHGNSSRAAVSLVHSPSLAVRSLALTILLALVGYFFVYTAYPVAAYQTIFRHATTRASQLLLRIAYRANDGNEFTSLWPRRDLRPFQYRYESGKDPFARGARRAIPKRSPRGVRARS